MKKNYYFKIIFCISVVWSSILFLSAQDTNNVTNIYTRTSYAEKIYLQLNNSVFTNEETIWFKAIVTDAKNVPTKLSGILHVELIDFDKEIVATKKLKLVNGIADNGFQLE